MQTTPGSLHAPCTRLLHVTPACNLTPWSLHVAFVQLNSIRVVELIEYLFTVSPKTQLLRSAEDP